MELAQELLSTKVAAFFRRKHSYFRRYNLCTYKTTRYLGNGKDQNESDNKNGQQVEHFADVGHRPQEDGPLDGIEHVGDEEEAAKNVNGLDGVIHNSLNDIAEVIGGEKLLNIAIEKLLEGVTYIWR